MFFIKHKAQLSFHVYKSSLVKSPKLRRLLSLHRKLCAIANKPHLWVLTLWLFRVDTLAWIFVESLLRVSMFNTTSYWKRSFSWRKLHKCVWSKIMTFITSEVANLLCILKFLTALKILLNDKSFFPLSSCKINLAI